MQLGPVKKTLNTYEQVQITVKGEMRSNFPGPNKYQGVFLTGLFLFALSYVSCLPLYRLYCTCEV